MAFSDYDCSGKCKFVYNVNKYWKPVEVTEKLPTYHEDKNALCPEAIAAIDSINKHSYKINQPIKYDSIFYKKGYEQGVDDYDKGLTPVRIIYNPPATIVFWADGEKTVVKCSKTEEFNKYHGFCAALAKRVVGNNSQLTKIVESGFVEGDLPVKVSKQLPEEAKSKKSNKKSKETKKK